MQFSEPEFVTRLKSRQSILIAGAGGGFDVFSGLPLYFFLRNLGKTVHLANLSFTNLAEVRGDRIEQHVMKIDADTDGPVHYFPERALSRWFRARGSPTPIYCFDKVGCRPLTNAFATLKSTLGIDAVVLVDGGTDILMRGDEAGLGTPQEDLTSVAAVNQLDVAEKIVMCLGFGIDHYHGVCHAHFLENVAALSKLNAFLGTTSLVPSMPEVKDYLEAVAFSSEQMPNAVSIVSTSIASAIEGEYGDIHRTPRTRDSTLWINSLMAMYWAFDLGAVAQRCLYLKDIQRTETAFRGSRDHRGLSTFDEGQAMGSDSRVTRLPDVFEDEPR